MNDAKPVDIMGLVDALDPDDPDIAYRQIMCCLAMTAITCRPKPGETREECWQAYAQMVAEHLPAYCRTMADDMVARGFKLP